MAKQEEIRGGMAETLYNTNEVRTIAFDDLADDERDYWLKQADEKVLYPLHSQGVVIKVDRELPKFPRDSELHPYGQAYVKGGRSYVQSLIESGYVAVEPLIEEK